MTRCLSVRQPFASIILSPVGTKTIENRGTNTAFRGRVGVHAPAKFHDLADLTDPRVAGLPLSAVLGTVQIVGAHSAGAGCARTGCYDDVWAMFPDAGGKPVWHWELSGARLFATPIRSPGALGFWEPGPSVAHLMSIAEVEGE